jgi:hypothetical protein
LTHKKDPYGNQQQHWEPADQDRHEPGRLLYSFCCYLYTLITQYPDQIGIIGNEGSKSIAVFVLAIDVVPLNGYLIHLSVRDGGDKLAVACLLLGLAGMVKHVEEQDDHQTYDQPES